MGDRLSTIMQDGARILDKSFVLAEQNQSLLEKITMLFQMIFGFVESFFGISKSSEAQFSSSESSELANNVISDEDLDILDAYYQSIKEESN